MEDTPKKWYGLVWEDGSFSVLARVTALDGSGDEVQFSEGNCLKQADISTITCKIYSLGADKSNASGTHSTPDPTLTASTNIYDTLQTTGWPTNKDTPGYNFRHDVSPSYVPNPNEWYLLEYKITMANAAGTVIWLIVQVKTLPVQSS